MTWTLIMIFMMNGTGNIAIEKIEGFKTQAECAEKMKWLTDEFPNNKEISYGKAQLTVDAICMAKSK